MEFRILGPLEVRDGADLRPVGGAGQRALLAVLLLHANEVVSSDRLIHELWGDEPPSSGAAALQVRVSQLRKSLGAGAGRLETKPPGYRLRLGPDELDLNRFSRLLEEAEGGEPAVAAERLREALALWRGAPLADFTYESFAQAAIGRLEELRMVALERCFEADLALGRHAELVGELEELVVAEPLRERLRGQLMLALYRSGRQAEALEAYRSTRSALLEGLGIEPSTPLRELEQAILRQDPELELARLPTPERSILVAARDEQSLESLLGLAEPLARKPPREVILAQLVPDAGALAEATRLVSDWKAPLIKRGLAVRAAAFTSSDPGRDLVRLATEQQVDLLLVDAPAELLDEGVPDRRLGAVLSGAPCDVGMLVPRAAGPDANRPVLVPFGGGDNDWAAVELGAWIASALGRSLTLTGTVGDAGRRDASRLLASVSLMVQQLTGISVEPILVKAGARAVIEAAGDACLLVVGLSGAWRQQGLGSARLAVARDARPPTLFVRGGLRPGGLAPQDTLTRFTWTLAGAESR